VNPFSHLRRRLAGGPGMSGPDRTTIGARNSGGYQFPRTDSASLRRGEAIREQHLPSGAIVRIVPLEGSNKIERMYDVCATFEENGVDVLDTTIARDELEAIAEFTRLCRRLNP
jgi:hypothetical protein